MFANLSNSQRIAGLIVVVVGVAGWVIAIISMGQAGELERQLTAKNSELVDVEKSFQQHQEATKSFEELTAGLDAGKSELAALKSEVAETKTQLESLRAEVRKQQLLLAGSTLKFRTTTRTKVRAGPSTEHQEVAIVPPGKSLEVFEIVEDGTWYKVGGMGYIFHELLEPVTKE